MAFTLHTHETADEKSQELLEKVRERFGFTPNLLGVMAESPELLEAYLKLGELFSLTSFSELERNIILLTVSYENHCQYCVAAHSLIAQTKNVPFEVVDKLRKGKSLEDEKLETLRSFVAAMIRNDGWPEKSLKQAFFDAGYTNKQLLEVILCISFKTISNYTNHAAETPLDDIFQATKWDIK